MNKLNSIIILAGGDSKRFWPLSDKNQITFLGKSLIEYQLERFSECADRTIVVGNKKIVDELLSIATKFNAEVVEQNGEGQASAILSSGVYEGNVLIVNASDLFEDFFYDRLWVEIDAITSDALFAARKVEKYFPAGILKIEGRRVLEVVEKPGAQNMPSNFLKVVVDYFKDASKLVEAIRSTKTEKDDWYEKSITAMIQLGSTIEFFEYDGIWTTHKFPWQVLLTQQFFLSKIRAHVGKDVQIDKTALIEGDVYIEDGAKLLEYSKVVGPAYIGRKTIVGNHTLIVNSMIGEECLIGAYSEVTRSYLGKHIWLHRNYIGDSVLEKNVLFGAGALTANYRFDEKSIKSHIQGDIVDTGLTKLGAIIGENVKIGVNTSIMPGIKIGRNVRIDPGIVVKRDIDS